MYVYQCGPIDWWHGWTRERDIASLDRGDEESRRQGLQGLLTDRIAAAKELLRTHTHWEGDGEFRVAPLPYPPQCDNEWMVCVKQSNNGSTYIVSPLPLDWLREDLVYSDQSSR